MLNVPILDALQTSGKRDEARQLFERALEIDPNYVTAHFNLAVIARLEGRLDDAIKHATDASKINVELISLVTELKKEKETGVTGAAPSEEIAK